MPLSLAICNNKVRVGHIRHVTWRNSLFCGKAICVSNVQKMKKLIAERNIRRWVLFNGGLPIVMPGLDVADVVDLSGEQIN